jgi:hypothetical protein
VPGGSAADVLGAVTGIESKPSSMAPACPAPCRRTGCLQLRTLKARAAARGQESASWPAVPALRASGWAAIVLRQRKG